MYLCVRVIDLTPLKYFHWILDSVVFFVVNCIAD